MAFSLIKASAAAASLAQACDAPGTTDADADKVRLIDLYHRYFEIIPALTTEQLMTAFRLRYEVYCVENAFEDPAAGNHAAEAECARSCTG